LSVSLERAARTTFAPAWAKLRAVELGPAGIRVNMVATGLTLAETAAQLPEQIKGMVANMTRL